MNDDIPLVVDFHVHMLDPEVFRAAEGRTVFTGFGTRPVKPPRPGMPAELAGRMMSADQQVEDLDRRGVHIGVISSSTVMQGTSWADPQTDLALCRRANDTVAAWTRKHPRRLVGSATVPLQDVGLAVAELERCVVEHGFRVANVGTCYGGAYLGAPVFLPFWEAVARHELTVWIHPEGVQDMWFQDYWLWNSLGQSIEETKAMASLVYEGVLHRLPGLKLVIAHGGGYFPHYMGRMDRNQGLAEAGRNIDGRAPSEFLRAFHYDTCVYDPRVLRTLVERVGADRLVLGSDHPIGESDPVGFLRRCGLSGEDLARACGGNAAALLGLR